MKAIVQDRYGGADALQLREVDAPTPREDEVLLRVRAASVNALDVHIARGGVARLFAGPVKPSQRVRGADVAGIVEAVGARVTRVKPGDEVFGVASGSFAELALSTEERLAPKPRRLGFEEAAALPVAGCTALQGLRDKARVAAGQHVLVHGAGGGVGTYAVQIAAALGARVTATTNARKMDAVRALGAADVLDHAREDPTARGPFDVFFDLGGDRPLAACRRALRPGGVLVVAGSGSRRGLGLATRPMGATLLARTRGPRVVVYVAQERREDLVALGDLVEAGKLTPVIGATYTLAETAEAVRCVMDGRVAGKVVVTVA